MIGLSIIPGLPLIIICIFMLVEEGFPDDDTSFLIYLAIILGPVGLVGLFLASIATTYNYKNARIVALMLLYCGYLAVLSGVLKLYFIGKILTEPGMLGPNQSTFSLQQIAFLFWVLAWPICAGVMAIIKLRSTNA